MTEAAINFPLDLVNAQIARLTGLTFRVLEFPAALEQFFEDATRPQRCRRLWLEGLVATIIFDAALCSEQWFLGGRSLYGFVLLLAGVTGSALLINASMLLQPRALLRESSVAAFACLLSITELMLRGHRSAAQSANAQFTLAGIAVFTNTVMRLRFPYAVCTFFVMSSAEVIFLQTDTILTPEGKLVGFALTLSIMMLTLIANYSQNRAERSSFLLCMRGDLLIEKLKGANRDLALAAETDRLTRLANRYAFDRRFAEVWKESIEQGTTLSLILVDIDHFKQLNDRYGHLYGDKVLSRVAHLLRESLRKKEDFAARFGGEEFVILLPSTQQESAMMVAERLRQLIELAGFPATESVDGALRGVSATVSCGVASVSPLVCDEPQRLLQAADEALYRSKELGRNAVTLAANPFANRALAAAC